LSETVEISRARRRQPRALSPSLLPASCLLPPASSQFTTQTR
jgi:hypothetical protein